MRGRGAGGEKKKKKKKKKGNWQRGRTRQLHNLNQISRGALVQGKRRDSTRTYLTYKSFERLEVPVSVPVPVQDKTGETGR